MQLRYLREKIYFIFWEYS